MSKKEKTKTYKVFINANATYVCDAKSREDAYKKAVEDLNFGAFDINEYEVHIVNKGEVQ